ncbi:hypothetical protein [Thermogladius sp.]|uniref:hypothetical protein n=1 Tax=Thermogladius sp. TaxID=2023064 RepID=UPI003D0C387E
MTGMRVLIATECWARRGRFKVESLLNPSSMTWMPFLHSPLYKRHLFYVGDSDETYVLFRAFTSGYSNVTLGVSIVQPVADIAWSPYMTRRQLTVHLAPSESVYLTIEKPGLTRAGPIGVEGVPVLEDFLEAVDNFLLDDYFTLPFHKKYEYKDAFELFGHVREAFFNSERDSMENQ